jgi:transcriptional regulator with XRE-family HTH domain
MRTKSKTMQFLEGLLGGPLTFGGMLVAIREGEEWSQAELARRLGVSAQHLGQVEKGRKAVRPERAAAWARELGYAPAHFVALALQAQVVEAGLQLHVHVTDEPVHGSGRAKGARAARKKAKATA